MPLFPIASEDSKDRHAFGQEVSPSKEAARTSTSKGGCKLEYKVNKYFDAILNI